MPDHRKPGITLEARLRFGDVFTQEEALRLTGGILTALEAYHSTRGLHLGICPAVIRFQEGKTLLLPPDSESPAERLWYTAPEVWVKSYGQIGCSSDLYSVCAVLFRLLMGRPMGEREMFGAGLSSCLAQLPRRTAARLGPILCRGLHTLPKKRYQSVEELRRDLNEEGEPRWIRDSALL